MSFSCHQIFISYLKNQSGTIAYWEPRIRLQDPHFTFRLPGSKFLASAGLPNMQTTPGHPKIYPHQAYRQSSVPSRRLEIKFPGMISVPSLSKCQSLPAPGLIISKPGQASLNYRFPWSVEKNGTVRLEKVVQQHAQRKRWNEQICKEDW